HQHIQSFRCPINRGRQTSWSCTDNNHVANVCLVDRFIETQAVCNLLVRWISQYNGATTYHYRKVADSHAEAIQQLLNLDIAFQINVGVRLIITCQELFDAER